MADLTSIAERLRIAANVLINPQTINPTIDALDAVTAERDQAVQGQERLQQQLMVQQAQQEKLTNKLEEITNTPNKLFEIFSPIIYASILYANANIYFFNKDPARLRATKLQLYLCKELSKLIGKHSGEKIFYELLAESGGLLHFSLELCEPDIKFTSRFKCFIISRPIGKMIFGFIKFMTVRIF